MNRAVQAAKIAYAGINFALARTDLPPERLRTASIYLLVTGCNISGAVAARTIGTSKQYVSKVLRQIEDAREKPALDAMLQDLEQQIFRVDS